MIEHNKVEHNEVESNKLVRDNIPTIIKNDAKTAITHIANEEEYTLKLHKKMQEEVDEFFKGKAVEKLADILEVVYTLARHEFHITPQELELLRKEKSIKRSGFKKRIIFEKVR